MLPPFSEVRGAGTSTTKEGTIPTKTPVTQEFDIECPGCGGSGESPKFKGQSCLNCGGKGRKLLRLKIPQPGDKVSPKIGQETLLTNIFGKNEKTGQPNITHKNVGIVHKTMMPEEHHLELSPTGLGVQVDFSGVITYRGNIPKGAEVELWTFDLYELKVL